MPTKITTKPCETPGCKHRNRIPEEKYCSVCRTRSGPMMPCDAPGCTTQVKTGTLDTNETGGRILCSTHRRTIAVNRICAECGTQFKGKLDKPICSQCTRIRRDAVIRKTRNAQPAKQVFTTDLPIGGLKPLENVPPLQCPTCKGLAVWDIEEQAHKCLNCGRRRIYEQAVLDELAKQLCQ